MTGRGPDATAGIAPASRLGIGALAAAVVGAMATAQAPSGDGVDRGLRDAVLDLSDPDRARAATARIVTRGSVAVPVLQDGYEAWRVGAPTVLLWHLLWVTGRLGPAGAELWPAAVDRVAFAGPAELPVVVDAIAALTDGPHGVPPHAVADRLEAAVTARAENLDLAPVVATLARLRIPADAPTTELLRIVADGDPRARVRAIELLAQRGDRSPGVRSVQRAAVDAEHPTRIAIGRHEQHDVAGRIAVQEAAERALEALAR